MEKTKTVKHASVRSNFFPDNKTAGTILLVCSICGQSAVGRYGQKETGHNVAEELKVELDRHDCKKP